ncbi:pericentriolar material 1 protein-like isoform X12 [Oryzias latipes]
MATGGPPFDDGEEDLHNWTVTSSSLDDRLNNMDWGVQQKKANRSSDKNKKKLSAAVVESRLTNDISPESTPGAGRRRAHTPHSFPHIKYTTQMSVPDQAELEKLRQRINFTDMDERSIGSDSQGRVTAANNQRQFAGEAKKPHNFLPLHVNTNKSKELLHPSASAPTTPVISKEVKKQSPGLREKLTPLVLSREATRLGSGDKERRLPSQREYGGEDVKLDSSQVVSKLVQIRDYIGKLSSVRDEMVEKNDVPAKVERLSSFIEHLREKEKSCLRLLQKMLAQEVDDCDMGTLESAVGSGSLAESASVNIEVLSSEVSNAADIRPEAASADQREELENLRKQHELLKKMLEQQEQLRALQGRQEALMAMQHSTEQALALTEDNIVTETTGSISGLSITSELNEELNELIQRFHNQLHDSQTKAVPDNRRQAQSLSLSREVCWSRSPLAVGAPQHRPLLHSASGPHAGLDSGASAASAKLTKLQELQDKKQTMDKILRELHSLRDQTLNNNSCRGSSAQHSPGAQGSSECPSALFSNGALASTSFQPSFSQQQDGSNSADKLRNSQRSRNWTDLNSLANRCSIRAATNNQDSRLNTNCEINNRTAANLHALNIPAAIECQYNRDIPYSEVRDDDGEEECACNDGAARAVVPDSVSESSRRSSLGNDAGFPQKVHRQSAKQKLRQLQELVAMVQSDDTDGTTANEDEAMHQQPNNTRATFGSGSKQSPRDLAFSSKAREKLYEEKLRQQKEELKQLHEERQRLIEIQNKIQDLQWACPDLQSSVSSTASQQGLLRKAPVMVSTPAAVKVTSSGQKTNLAVLKPAAPEAPAASATDDGQLWSEMRRRQIMREDLRQRRKHLESLMAEHQRRNGFADSSCPIEDHEENATPSLSVSRDERTMATWGSSPCHLDNNEEDDDDGHDAGETDEYHSELGAEEEDEEEEVEECTGSSSDDDLPLFSPNRNQGSYTNKENQGSNLKPPAAFSGESDVQLHNKTKTKPQTRSFNQSSSQHGGVRRQENLRWASELSVAEGTSQWQEQVNHLQRQLDFSSGMCQTLLQDQQTLSFMLQSLLTGQYSVLPNNRSSPQVQLVMHQLNQCYTQLAWQQNNIQRLKQVLNDLLGQQLPPSSSAAAWQTQKRGSAQESSCGPSASPGVSLPFSSTLHPSANNMPAPPMSPFPSTFTLFPPFPSTLGGFLQEPFGPTTPEHQKQRPDPNTSFKTEYMSFPPPLQRSPLNTAKKTRPADRVNTSYTNNIRQLKSSKTAVAAKTELQETPPSSPFFAKCHSRTQEFDKESFSSVPDVDDPNTITKAFKAGRKASAQANLASRSRTPKNRRRRSKVHNKNGHDSDSASSTTDFGQQRAASSHHRDQNQMLLDKLTQEKLDSKTKLGRKRNDISSDASSDFSLFEALRETIYSEVATLISQNESRPHFLIELFHELQLLNTDYLRQRALYSLQDIVTKHLEVRSAAEDQPPRLGPVAWPACSQSELTPSQSLSTSDDEVVEKNLRHARDTKKRKEDADSVDDSNMSTSSNLEAFANDDLGAAAGSVHCPQIDTQQLDRQIKAIMTEVIPFLKENMDEVCSLQLLTSVRRMVLKLTQQNDESKEFVHFFHRQLGGILQDSLSKFVGCTLKDCGEDLLVEISEILFNELAFFKLMQDLENSNSSKKATKQKRRVEGPSKPKRTPEENAVGSTEKSLCSAKTDEDKDQDETLMERSCGAPELYLQTKSNRSNDASENEDEEQGLEVLLSFSLSKAEIQALTSYGSGEDENEEEETEEFEAGPVEVQTSLQVSADGQVEQGAGSGEIQLENPKEESLENDGEANGLAGAVSSPLEENIGEESQIPAEEEKAAAAQRDSAPSPPQNVPRESTSTSSPDTDSPVLISVDEAGSGNTSHKSDEEDFVKVDDLPLQLTVMTEEELQKRIVEEQQNNNLSMEILSDHTELLTELVGNAQTLKQPESMDVQNAE